MEEVLGSQGGRSAVRALRVGPVFILRIRIVVVKNEDATPPVFFLPLTFQKNVIHLMTDINAEQDDPLIQCRKQVLC